MASGQIVHSISVHIGLLLLAAAGFVFLGDANKETVAILAPFPSDSLTYDQGQLLLLSVAKPAGDSIILSTQWERVRAFDLRGDSAREGFPKEFYRLFEPRTTIEYLTYSFKYLKGYSAPESLGFAYADTFDIRALWKAPAFAKLVGEVRNSSGTSEVLVHMKGWFDTLCTTPYDDPNSDGRALYKLHIRLVPGVNSIYIAPSGDRTNAALFTARFVMDSKPVAERATLFHNSALEQSCGTCHEGLPSADGGVSMKADCGVCHKSKTAAAFLHAPAEAKECGSCHTWSTEKHAMVVEKGVPGACYDCHADKQVQVDSSASMHPVAADCATCHSPHGSEQNHLVKEKVYILCTGCHEDQKMNHPVGRHPVRFALMKNGEEISCVSCHDPHGSPNEHLLRFAGGKIGACSECH